MTRVHREELALDVRSEVIDVGGAGNGRLGAGERRPVDDPFEEGLHGDVQSLPGGLVRHDPVDRRVGENRPFRKARLGA